MKKTIAFALAVAVAMTLFGILSFAEGTGKPVVTVSEDGLHKTVDFTAMEVTDTVLGAIEAADIGAVDMDVNYQIAFYDGANVFFTVNGYDPAWVIYEVDAPVGQVLDTLKLKIVGRIADYGPVANAFAVFARDDGFDGEANACELNMIAADSRQPEDWASSRIRALLQTASRIAGKRRRDARRSLPARRRGPASRSRRDRPRSDWRRSPRRRSPPCRYWSICPPSRR